MSQRYRVTFSVTLAVRSALAESEFKFCNVERNYEIY